jgi:hypothetical protein
VIALLSLALSFAGDANAGAVTPIEITMVGPGPVRIRVAEGRTFPCDSADNRPLVQGKFNPGQVVRSQTADNCVCLQQTYEPFPDVDWAPAARVCRPQICKRAGRGKYCVPAPDPTIRLAISSRRP